jgi:serine/threonine protein kinase
MIVDPSTADGSLPPAQQIQLDQVCDRFEAAWKTADAPSQQPRIEDFLADVPQPLCSALLRELLNIEVAWRKQAGETVRLEDYWQRFPDHFKSMEVSVQSRLFRRRRNPQETGPLHEGESLNAAAVTPPLPNDAAPTGLAIPGYDLGARLGGGGMGVVYQARQPALKRQVALKLMRDAALAGAEQRARFRVEAEAMARLQHPNIVQIYEVGEHQGQPFFAMELAGGGSLDRKLAAKPLPPTQGAELVQTLARAVEHAHQRGIVHRDLKPANVLLTGDGRPLITDFGLAKCLDRDTAWTQSGAVLGTASYMPPEQAEGKTQDINHLADVYSLGAILYEVLTGQPPFRGATVRATLEQVIHDMPTPPTSVQPQVPAELEAICLKCLEKEPGQRYDSARVLAHDLQSFLAGEWIGPSKAGDEHWLKVRALRAGYKLLEEVGRSAHTVVYKAQHGRLLRPVALKLYSTQVSDPPQRWERAGELAPRFEKLPGFVEIYHLGAQDKLLFLAMEFLSGGTLAQKLGTAWPLRDAVEVVATLAQSIAQLHQHGMVHGNLKPSNVLFTADGKPKVADFDLVAGRHTRNDGAPQQGRPNPGAQASDYLAPEQATGETHQPTKATDVYAVGAILHELLTGHSPFLVRNLTDTIGPILGCESPAGSALETEYSQRLDKICRKCLQKDPQERYADAQELAAALQQVLIDQEAYMPRAGRLAIPGFEILGRLGRGRMSTVYKARDQQHQRLVALRVVEPRVHLTTAAIAHFIETAQAVTKLHHPHIVQVYSAGNAAGLLYLVMEYVDGGTLAQKWRGSPQPPIDAASLISTLARALDHAHHQGIIHMSLTPHNVLVTTDGIPKVSDFALAKQIDEDLQQTAAGAFVGTPTYMAPELAMGNWSAIGPATDVYALGAILYERLTGRPPFQGEHLLDVLFQAASAAVVPPSKLQAAVPPALEKICLRCLNKDPQKRYTRAEDLAVALDRFQAGEPIAAPTIPTLVETTQSPGFWKRLLRRVSP